VKGKTLQRGRTVLKTRQHQQPARGLFLPVRLIPIAIFAALFIGTPVFAGTTLDFWQTHKVNAIIANALVYAQPATCRNAKRPRERHGLILVGNRKAPVNRCHGIVDDILLIDVNDLYAANVSGSINMAELHGSDLVAGLTLKSPRPVRMALASSPQLNRWAPDSAIRKARGMNPREWTIATPVDSVDKFVRIAARAPNQ